MKGLSPRNEDEREFIKTFDSLIYGQSRYQVWADFVHIFALSIVNQVGKVHFEEREKQYQRIVKPYKQEDMEKFARLAAITTMALERNPNQDFLGELYMRCDLGNDNTGQFFTPYHICEMMAKCILDGDTSARADIEEKGYMSIADPCIGGGAMLIGAAHALHTMGINYQQYCVFVGQDIDYTVAMMAYIQLSLLGCPGYIKVGNSLADPLVGHVLFGEGTENVYYMPMFFTERMEMLRHAERMRALFRSVFPSSEKLPEAENAHQLPEPAIQAQEPEETPKAPIEVLDQPSVIEVSKKKGKAIVGQMMFDFE